MAPDDAPPDRGPAEPGPGHGVPDGGATGDVAPASPSEVRTMRAFLRSFVALKHGDAFAAGEVVDIGRRGIFVTGDHLFPVGARVELRFALHRGEGTALHVYLEGEVVRARSEPTPDGGRRGMAIRFLSLEPEVKAAILEYLDRSEVRTVYREGSGARESLDAEDPGRYEMLELVGEGGTCNVYKAYDHRHRRVVALKVLREEWADDEDWRKRFEKEIRITSEIDDPHVARVDDVGRIGHRAFFTMPFIAGESLQELLDERGRLPEAEVLELALQALQGVAAAHARGIVHRDLKPSNVMVTREGMAIVVDFGFARRPEDSHLTHKNTWVGTVSYMAPEQFKGTEVDARTDVYALGCLLYAALVGRPPFEGAPFEISGKHVSAPVEPPGGLLPDLDAELERAILTALSKDPADRQADARELAAELRPVRDRLLARRPTPRPRPAPPPDRVVLAMDDAVAASPVEARLVELGLRVDRVEDGFAAIEAAFTLRPAALILERRLPVIDGLDACRILRSDPRATALPIAVVADRETFSGQGRFVRRQCFLARDAGPSELDACLAELGLL